LKVAVEGLNYPVMMRSPQPDYTSELKALLAKAKIPSFRALSRQAETSLWPIQQLRQGRADRLSVRTLVRLAAALCCSPLDLVRQFSPLILEFPNPTVNSEPSLVDISRHTDRKVAQAPNAEESLRQECQRLQTQLATLSQELRQTFQQECLEILEPLLIQLPVALHSAAQNPELPAAKLIPVLRPFDRLLAEWGVVEIGPVGAVVPYDCRWHQPIATPPAVGDPVKIRYPGYRQGETLLYRAKVGLPDLRSGS